MNVTQQDGEGSEDVVSALGELNSVATGSGGAVEISSTKGFGSKEY